VAPRSRVSARRRRDPPTALASPSSRSGAELFKRLCIETDVHAAGALLPAFPPANRVRPDAARHLSDRR